MFSLIRKRYSVPITNYLKSSKLNFNCNYSGSTQIQRIKRSLEEDKLNYGIVPVFKKTLLYGNKIGIKDEYGEYTFNQIFVASKNLATQISNICNKNSSERVIIVCPNNVTFVLAQFAVWISGQIAVPLSTKIPNNLLKYYINDSDASLVLTTSNYESSLKQLTNTLKKPLIVVEPIRTEEENIIKLIDEILENDILINTKCYSESNAMILYTSGTTAKPKGVLISHKNIYSQLECLTDAWNINENDNLLHVLPLNHVHGCVNGLLCPIYNGGKCIMLPSFNSKIVWNNLLQIESKEYITIFMAVPTIYNFLIQEYRKNFNNKRLSDYIRSHCINNIRLMISGSAPLTLTVFNEWLEITGHKLLERYGMTEIGMALSNPYIQDDKRKRIPGTVGNPLPNVEVRILDPITKEILYERKGYFNKGYWSKNEVISFNSESTKKYPNPIIGELYIRGPNVFKEYWRRPEVTKLEIDENGWFKTGDTVSFQNDVFKILGRTSVDVIKSGGHKLSALEIENQLLEHPNIVDVAVVGLSDSIWGQKVASLIVCKNNEILDTTVLKQWCLNCMPSYSIPSIFKFIDIIPRNAMGKVNKKELINTIFSDTKN